MFLPELSQIYNISRIISRITMETLLQWTSGKNQFYVRAHDEYSLHLSGRGARPYIFVYVIGVDDFYFILFHFIFHR